MPVYMRIIVRDVMQNFLAPKPRRRNTERAKKKRMRDKVKRSKRIFYLPMFFVFLLMNCKNDVINTTTTQLTPLNISTSIGVWRQCRIETYQDNVIQSTIDIADTGVEQVYLEVIDSSNIYLSWIHRRVRCTEDYAWQHSVCDTLPPCRTSYDMRSSINEFFSVDSFIVRELHIISKNGKSTMERRFMKRFIGQFPPAQYMDTCLSN